MKGKYVETKFEKSLVIRQSNAFKSQRQSILGKLATFFRCSCKERFIKSKTVTINNVSSDLSNLVTTEILPQNVNTVQKNTNVIAPEMYKVQPNQTRTTQLSQDIRKTNKCVSFSTGVIPTTSVSRPQLKSNKFEDRLLEIILFIVDSKCSKHMTGNLKLLSNFVEKFLGTVKFRNDQIASILGYGDLVQGNITIRRVYYVEGLNHNLFFVGQFCDADLEVTFRKSTCYIRDLKGNDLLTDSHGTDLYFITLQDTSTPNLICLMAKTSSSQAWLWHRRLLHLKFNTINLLSKYDIVTGLPKLKFVKDHFCTSCELGKAKRKSFKTKTTPSSKRRLQILHMDLCGPMRVESFNGKKYVLVIVDDYSRYTWTRFLRSKDETPKVLIDFLKLVQRGLHAQVRTVRTDKGTEFLNKTLHAYFAQEGFEHQTSTARTPEQNGVGILLSQELTGLSPGPQSQQNVPQAADKVYRLKKALYGLKQAPRAWYDELSNFLVSKGFSKGSIDPTLFITKKGEDILLVQIYVDDIIFGSTNPKLSKNFKKLMHNKFEMFMIGELKFFLGIQIHQSPRGIFINQAKYTQKILKKHGMTSCDSIGTPMATKPLDVDLSGTLVDQTKYRSMVGALMYLTASRPDIVHATCYCARYQAIPTEKHLKEVKRIFRYLKNTINMGLWYPKDTDFELTAFLNLDRTGCLDSRKSTYGGIQFLGSDKLVSSSKKQDYTSMSLAEAEYVSLSTCCAQVLWIRTQLTDYGFYFDKIPMHYDSQAAIAISCNPVKHSRTKHIDVKHHFIKEQIKGKMPTKVELTLEQSQQGVSDDVLFHSDEWKSFQYHHQTALRSYALSWKPYQGDSLNLPDHRYKRRCCSPVLAKSDSLPHAHTQAFKVNHSASRLLIQTSSSSKNLKSNKESSIGEDC
ncbi:retrovirus-related pol polyprotein from transposon TNT 1-94 [Tanacetum coccineum]